MKAKFGMSRFINVAELFMGGILSFWTRVASFLACVLHASPTPKRQTALNLHFAVLREVDP